MFKKILRGNGIFLEEVLRSFMFTPLPQNHSNIYTNSVARGKTWIKYLIDWDGCSALGRWETTLQNDPNIDWSDPDMQEAWAELNDDLDAAEKARARTQRRNKRNNLDETAPRRRLWRLPRRTKLWE
jgi:hypothetical protein